LLLRCARSVVEADAASGVEALVRRDFSWDRFLHRVTHHRVTPLAFHGLKRLRNPAIPDSVLRELGNACNAIAARNLFLTRELIGLVDWLEGEHIAVLPYKGPTIAYLAYGNIALRQFGDLDVLVSARDYGRARDLFLARGHRLTDDWGWECSLTDENRSVTTDLHVGLAPAQFPTGLGFDRLWERRQVVPMAGGKLSTLSAKDLLIILCVQLIKDAWGISALRLAKACDIAELLRSNVRIDWNYIFRETRRTGCRRMLQIALTVAGELLGAPMQLPGLAAPDGSRTSRLVDHVVSRIFEDGQIPFPGLMSRQRFHFDVRERWRDKLYPWYWDFKRRLPPNELDFTVIDLPKRLRFLYWLIHPVRVARDFARRELDALRSRRSARPH
jgi:hypothetical protein